MAESDLHREIMFYIIHLLQRFFRGQQVYVSGNLLIYYEQGNRYKSFAPDCFVVRGVAPRKRRIYKLWEEGQAPQVVFEVTSSSTRADDLGKKMRLYARLGVQEYYLYDPTADYLKPPLAAYTLVDGQFVPMTPFVETVSVGDLEFPPSPDEPPTYLSPRLGLRMTLDEHGGLLFYDSATDQQLLSDEEARLLAELSTQRAEEQAAAERRRAEYEHRRAEEAELELARLRAELVRLQDRSE
jgi:hypothetical protein